MLENFYPVPKGKPLLRPTPFMPYLSFAPSAWVLPLKFTGGGLSGGGKLMFDSQGNAWVVDNFQVGAQNQDSFWRGGLSKFAPNGKPLSPAVSGFTGGGMLGPGFGLAIDATRQRVGDQLRGQQHYLAVRQQRQAALAARGL